MNLTAHDIIIRPIITEKTSSLRARTRFRFVMQLKKYST